MNTAAFANLTAKQLHRRRRSAAYRERLVLLEELDLSLGGNRLDFIDAGRSDLRDQLGDLIARPDSDEPKFVCPFKPNW